MSLNAFHLEQITVLGQVDHGGRDGNAVRTRIRDETSETDHTQKRRFRHGAICRTIKALVILSLVLRPSSSICLLMLCHSIAWVWQRTGDQVDFPMKLPKLPQTCPEFCMRFYLTKRGERQSDITDSLFLFYLELYILNLAVI